MIMPTRRIQCGSWNPVREMRKLEQELSSFLDTGFRPAELPAVNLWANENEAVVTAELPGVERADLTLTVVEQTLLMEGERKATEGIEEATVLREERSSVRFSRRIRLPYEVAHDAVSATLKNGVLRVTLPRHARTKPQTIAITTD